MEMGLGEQAYKINIKCGSRKLGLCKKIKIISLLEN